MIGLGSDLEVFLALNPDYSSSIPAGEKMELKIAYCILNEYMTLEEIQNTDIKIVYSYYPTKNYFFYPAEERVKERE